MPSMHLCYCNRNLLMPPMVKIGGTRLNFTKIFCNVLLHPSKIFSRSLNGLEMRVVCSAVNFWHLQAAGMSDWHWQSQWWFQISPVIAAVWWEDVMIISVQDLYRINEQSPYRLPWCLFTFRILNRHCTSSRGRVVVIVVKGHRFTSSNNAVKVSLISLSIKKCKRIDTFVTVALV